MCGITDSAFTFSVLESGVHRGKVIPTAMKGYSQQAKKREIIFIVF